MGGAAQDGQDAGDQLLGGEGHGEEVVHAPVERLELGPQVAPAGQGDDGHPLRAGRRGVAQAREHLAPGEVHVHHREVGPPLPEHRRRGRGVRGDAGPEPAVDVGQGQLDHPGEHGLVEHQQHPRGAPPGPGAVRAGGGVQRGRALGRRDGGPRLRHAENDTTPAGRGVGGQDGRRRWTGGVTDLHDTPAPGCHIAAAGGGAGAAVTAAPAATTRAALDAPPAEHPMTAHEPDVVRWLLLVGATLLGAVLAGLAQRRWWRGADALPGSTAAASSMADAVARARACSGAAGAAPRPTALTGERGSVTPGGAPE